MATHQKSKLVTGLALLLVFLVSVALWAVPAADRISAAADPSEYLPVVAR